MKPVDASKPSIPRPYDEKHVPIEGVCWVLLKVDINGNPGDIHMDYCTDKRLEEYAAADAAQQEFVPGMKKGKPVPSKTMIVVPVYEDIDPSTIEKLDLKNGHVLPPKPVYTPEAKLPKSARQDRNSAHQVEFSTIVTKFGNLENLHITKSAGSDYDSYALDAVRQWRLKPATLNGEPVAVQIEVQVKYTIY
jgi:TonB family protein